MILTIMLSERGHSLFVNLHLHQMIHSDSRWTAVWKRRMKGGTQGSTKCMRTFMYYAYQLWLQSNKYTKRRELLNYKLICSLLVLINYALIHLFLKGIPGSTNNSQELRNSVFIFRAVPMVVMCTCTPRSGDHGRRVFD